MKWIQFIFDRISLYFSEAMTALKRHTLMTFAAITTIAVALFLAGGLGYAYYRVEQYTHTLSDRFEMRVFLEDGTTVQQIQRLAVRLRELNGVTKVEWIPRDKMWEKMQKDNPEMTAGVINPLPDSFKVKIADLSQGDILADQIRQLPEVTKGPNGIQYLKSEQEMLSQALKLVRWLGSVFGGLLALTGGILIYNAIRLSIVSRQLEIRIMGLVGASRLTINTPFYLEGLFQGLVGGVVATLLILAANQSISGFIQTIQVQGSVKPSTPPIFPLEWMILILGGIGVSYGLICTFIALWVPIRED